MRRLDSVFWMGGLITGTNMCVLICAMVIASVGLNMNSTAVIIGAMLISPIMGSILASAFASVSADYPLLRNHMVGFGMQIVISVTAAAIYFFLSPVKEPTADCLQELPPHFLICLSHSSGGLQELSDRPDKTKQTQLFRVLQLQPL